MKGGSENRGGEQERCVGLLGFPACQAEQPGKDGSWMSSVGS